MWSVAAFYVLHLLIGFVERNRPEIVWYKKVENKIEWKKEYSGSWHQQLCFMGLSIMGLFTCYCNHIADNFQLRKYGAIFMFIPFYYYSKNSDLVFMQSLIPRCNSRPCLFKQRKNAPLTQKKKKMFLLSKDDNSLSSLMKWK